jgi:glycosyltransferase domain-containing protein
MPLAQNITIIIPTKDRTEFVATMVHALNEQDFGGVLILCDASDAETYAETQARIHPISPRFEVIHECLPGKKHAPSVDAILEKLKTPYCIYLPDDDIPVATTLQKCGDFLDGHPDYSAVAGNSVIISIDEDRIFDSTRFKLRPFEDPAPLNRVRDLLNDYCVVHYSIGRSDQFKKRWADIIKIPEPYIGTEIMGNCLHLMDGKVKILEDLFVVREDHSTRQSKGAHALNWILSENWRESTLTFIEIMSERISGQSNLSKQDATDFITLHFWNYLNKANQRQFNAISKSKNDTPLVEMVRQQPLLRKFARQIKSRFVTKDWEYQLDNLLKPNSRFFNEFSPIYHFIQSSLKSGKPQ